jgi:protein SCO1/2
MISLATALPAKANGIQLDVPVPVAAFALEDHKGDAFTEATLSGDWTLIMLGFTYCPDVCPFTLSNLEAVIAEVSLRVRPDNVPDVVFLSVDPDRDKDGLADYVAHFHPSFLGVTGERDQIDRYVESVDAFYRFVGEGDDYEVQHSASIAVIAPDGTLRAKLQPPLEPGPIAEFLARLQIQYRRDSTG